MINTIIINNNCFYSRAAVCRGRLVANLRCQTSVFPRAPWRGFPPPACHASPSLCLP